MLSMQDQFYEYRGFKYSSAVDQEDDNIKRFHEVITPNGEVLMIPNSPYRAVNEFEFREWVENYLSKQGG